MIPAKGENPLHEVAAVAARLHDGFQILLFAASFRHLLRQQLRQRKDRHQSIVEIVRYASGEGAERWRALLNESQIVLHNHPINAVREARGAVAVNSLWFWGAGTLPDSVRCAVITL